MVTVDDSSKKECDSQEVQYIDLSMILGSLWRKEVLTKEDVRRLIDEIEKRDRVKFKNKREILG